MALPVETTGLSCYEVSFLAVSGAPRREPLESAWRVRFEDVPPTRSFPAFKKQKNFPGLWWSATTGQHVGYESWVERDHAIALDFDTRVVAFSSQPFWLSWHDGSREHRHAPDYFARLTDGTGVVIDIRPDHRVRPRDVEVFDRTRQACNQVGWEFRRRGVLGQPLAENLRWLAGYRNPRCFRQRTASRLMEVFSTPQGLFRGAERVGDRLAVLPVLYHLIWRQVLRSDLENERLNSRSIVRWERA